MLSLRELERAASILEREIVGHRIQAASQTGPYGIVLELYGGGQRRQLVLSADPESARVCLAERAPKGAPGTPRFAQYLRAHVRGARVEGVELLDGDRQLRFRLGAREGRLSLLLAIFGRKSNVVVLDAEDRIGVALRPLRDTRPELSQGDPWSPPGRAVPRVGEDRFADVPDEEFFAAVDAHYAATEQGDAGADLRRRVETALRKEAKALDRKLEKLARELASAEAAIGLERQGELLKSVLADVKRGDAEALVRDWDSGEEVRIPLDPTLSPSENLSRLFKRYQKAVRVLTKAGAQQDAVQRARDDLTSLERAYAEIAGDASDAEERLTAFVADAEMARLLAKFAPAPSVQAKSGPAEPKEFIVGKRVVPPRFVPRRFRTAGNLEIWVGRSDAANDYLSTRLARGNDLFFHLDGAPGSHVVLRTEGKLDPPSEAVLDACELAVHYSKAKKAGRADVHVVPIRNVSKPKGVKPGLVMVHGGKTVHLRREAARLERVLAAKIET